MNRIRACNCSSGSSVPVTVNEPRKPARLPTAAKSSNVLNFRSARPNSVCAVVLHAVHVAIQRGVVVEQFADRRHAAGAGAVHVLAAFEDVAVVRGRR